MSKAYLLLGSNKGNRLAFINQATDDICKRVGNIITYSLIYETEPWGFIDNTFFLNKVLIVETNLKPQQLLTELKTIELKLGRIKTSFYASRTIDIDILFYDNLIISDENLIIPHPQLHKRMFTLLPLSEIAPDFIHPLLNKDLQTLTNECEDKTKVNLYYQEKLI
ncbi:MAG: 2-amino-4-hydroxy-6-hydroxymethyldihydropteridine diphosphokinase [Bacteroidetes bacterium CG2_30_32_10]|nr:MAG: 2-amino-4-hydroxy-6-hydroxymethyldihydropteridine diphosphokinase [Bacteroidetes bacterium CG2_30_32_10]